MMAAKSDFRKMSPGHSADTLGVKNFIKIISNHFQDKCVFVFYAKFLDGCQKWRESDFCEKSPVEWSDNLQVRNFVEIALSHTVSEINAPLRFTQKFKMAAKSGGKATFEKTRQ